LTVFAGTEQVHQPFGDPATIKMSSNNKYKKSLQLDFPQAPETW